MKALQAAASFALPVLLAACAQLPAPQQPARQIEAGALHLEKAGTQTTWPAERWWEGLGDEQLGRLVSQALTGSPGIELAAARVRDAQASLAGAQAAAGINISTGGNVTREKLTRQGLIPPPYAGTVINEGRATLDFSYDFDWWGGHRAAVEAALGRERAAEVDVEAARQVLVSALAGAYFSYQADLRRLDIAKAGLARREELLRLSVSRVAHGLDPVTPQRSAEGDIAGTRYAIVQLEAGLALQRNQIAALIGIGPGDLPPIQPSALPAVEAQVPADLSIGLVGRRPEIQAQRRRIEAASRQIDAARAQFYPDISITAFLGFSSVGLNKLFQAHSEIAGVTPAIRLPLFDSGRLKANLASNQAGLDSAIAQYNQSIVDAVHQVADQAATLDSLDRQQAALSQSQTSAEQLLAIARNRQSHGLGDYAAVLQAQGAVEAQQDLQAQLDARRIAAKIALIKALGGGYQDNTPDKAAVSQTASLSSDPTH